MGGRGKEICRPKMRQRGRRCGEDSEGLEAIAITDSKVSKVFNVVRHAVPKKTCPRDQSHGCFHLVGVRIRKADTKGGSLTGSLRGAQRESMVSQLLHGARGEGR